jgi:tetratricopeptide (TPR) repeat protein
MVCRRGRMVSEPRPDGAGKPPYAGGGWNGSPLAASPLPEGAVQCLAAGALALRQGRLDRAAGSFRKALAILPDCGEAYAGLAMTYQQSRDFPAAIEMYLKCLERDGDNLAALLGLFQASCRMGSFARIIHYLQLYLAGHPDDASVLFCLAALHAREGRLELAEAGLRQVLALAPDKAEAAELLAKVRQAGAIAWR